MILQIRDKEIVNKHAVRSFFAGLKDGRYELKADRLNKRSNAQNRLLWGCVYPQVLEGLKDAGFEDVTIVEDVHMICRNLFLKVQKANEHGEMLEYFRSTTTLSKMEFSHYVERIIIWAAEYLNVALKMPEENLDLWKLN